MDAQNVIVDSLPTLEIPSGGPERHEWRMTGKLPIPEEKAEEVKTPADSSTAKDVQAESSTAPTEPEVEVEPEPEVARPKKRGAEARIIELLEENRRLKEQIGTKETKAEPSPAPKPPEALKEPDINDYTTMGDYQKALSQFYRETARQEALQAVREEAFQRDVRDKVTQAKERYEDFADVAKPVVDQLVEGVNSGKINRTVMEAIDDSPYFADLLYVIGGDAANAQDFLGKAQSNPRLAIKMIGRMEQLISEEMESASRPRDEKGKFATEKKVSKAPPPPTELGGTSGPPPDEAASAAERGDFRSFRAAANRRDMASRRG